MTLRRRTARERKARDARCADKAHTIEEIAHARRDAPDGPRFPVVGENLAGRLDAPRPAPPDVVMVGVGPRPRRPRAGDDRPRGAPQRLDPASCLLVPRTRPIRTATWLELVRRLPCAFCGAAAPSDPHHYPGKGATGGGSDLETCPACRTCHDQVHAGTIPATAQAGAVQRTMRAILMGVRTGEVLTETLLAIALEVDR